MAWTEPKSWVVNDPLTAQSMNTYIRDNQIALRAQAEDAESKLGKTFPAYQSPLLVGYAVILPVGTVRISGTSFQIWHEKCKLTFTPKTDLVLFGVQYQWWPHGHLGGAIISGGLQKDGSLYGATFTDTTDTTSDLNTGVLYQQQYTSLPSGEENMMMYQAPVVVTRNVETTIAPMVRIEGVSGSIDLRPGAPMFLTALDVGAYE